jgi:small subunit ribosomal protein S17
MKILTGIVISDKMQKSATVSVTQTWIHPKYKKRYSVRKSYKVHDEKESFKIGDKVTFIECRPLSKEKKWRVIYS